LTTATQQSIHPITPERTSDTDRELLWKYIDENDTDTPESLQRLRYQLSNNQWDETRLRDWIRRKRQSVTSQEERFDDSAIQIMQSILESNRHWRTLEYIKSLTCVLQRGKGPRLTEEEVTEWMGRMQYMDSRNGIISTTKTVKAKNKRKNVCKVQDVPLQKGWTEFQKSESSKITGKYIISSKATVIKQSSTAEEILDRIRSEPGSTTNRGAVMTKLVGERWQEMDIDEANEHIEDPQKRSYWRLKAVPGFRLYYADFCHGKSSSHCTV